MIGMVKHIGYRYRYIAEHAFRRMRFLPVGITKAKHGLATNRYFDVGNKYLYTITNSYGYFR